MSEFNTEDKIEAWNFDERVRFCLFCCYKVKYMMSEKSLKALELVEKWIRGELSTSYLMSRYDNNYFFNEVHYTIYCTVRSIIMHELSVDPSIITNVIYCASNVAYHLNISYKTIYEEYMRDVLSNIMES